jgi:hypothetical protein
MPSELPFHYIHWDNRDRRQTEDTKAEYFSISWEWHLFLQYGIARRPTLILIVASYDMLVRSQCYYSFSPGTTGANLRQ